MDKVQLTREEKLRQEQGRQVKEMCQTEGWRKVIFPILEAQVKSAVVDPRKFKSDEEYLYAQKIAWAYGQAYSDLLIQIDAKAADCEYLTEKEEGKIKDKLREAIR